MCSRAGFSVNYYITFSMEYTPTQDSISSNLTTKNKQPAKTTSKQHEQTTPHTTELTYEQTTPCTTELTYHLGILSPVMECSSFR